MVALPALALVKLSHVPVADFFHWPFLASLGGGMLITFLIGLLVARQFFPGSLTAHGLHGLTAMYSSTGYIGLPLILLVFGDTGLVPALIGAVITGSVFLPIAIVLAEIDSAREGEGNIASALIKVLLTPVLFATIAGLLLSSVGVALPAPVETMLLFFGDAYVPCALFAAGLFIAECSVTGLKTEIGWLVVAKLLLHPLITWVLVFYVFELDGILAVIAVLQAALPCGVPVFALAQQHGVFVVRSSAVIVISTLLSVLTLSALLLYFEGFAPGQI